jgi:hypothetical protein
MLSLTATELDSVRKTGGTPKQEDSARAPAAELESKWPSTASREWAFMYRMGPTGLPIV